MAEKKAEKTVRVFITDDHSIMRKGLHDLVAAEPGFTVCGEAGNGVEGLRKIEELQPDVVLTDIDMPQMSGIEMTRSIRSKKWKCRVVILTMHSEESFYTAAMDAGAMGYVLKEGAVSDIVQAVRSVCEGKYYISPSLSTFTIGRAQEIAAERDGTSLVSMLTQTERKVLKLISQNMTTKQIAEELFVSHRTIDSHRSNIAAKLQLQGQNALLRFALENKHKL